VALCRSGLKTHEVGARFGLSQQQVSAVCVRQRNREIYDLWKHGWTQAQISDEYSICGQRIRAIFRKIEGKPEKPKAEPAEKPPRRNPLYVRELERRLPGGDRYEHMLRLEPCYTRLPGEAIPIFGFSLLTRGIRTGRAA